MAVEDAWSRDRGEGILTLGYVMMGVGGVLLFGALGLTVAVLVAAPGEKRKIREQMEKKYQMEQNYQMKDNRMREN